MMQRKIFIKQLPEMESMPPSLNAATNLIADASEENTTISVGETLPICEDRDAVIKVIGVGGGGCNALNLMIDKGVYSAEFIAIDSDAQALKHSRASTHVRIGATEESREADRVQIIQLINDAHMIFIVAGMGGETGMAAAALVAQISRKMNILTIAVVTNPSVGEADHRAAEEIKVLRENVDSLIVVSIDDLMRIHGVAMPEVFKIAHGVMKDTVAGIAEMVNMPGLIGVDFADVCTVMSEKGSAMVGVGGGAGPERARLAAERAIAGPLFKNMNLSNALGMLVNITSTSSIKLQELDDVMGCMQFASEYATIVVGAIFDETMGDEMRVTIVVTGMGLPEIVYQERHLARLNAVKAMLASGDGNYEIPSFLRK